MSVGILWLLIGCLETIQGLSLIPSYSVAGTESKLVKMVSRQLSASGFLILGKNQRLMQNLGRDQESLAEFDLIARDQDGKLCLIEIKNRINPGAKVNRQFSRYLAFLNESSPFVESIKRVIVVSRPVDIIVKKAWLTQGLEFFDIVGDQVVFSQP